MNLDQDKSQNDPNIFYTKYRDFSGNLDDIEKKIRKELLQFKKKIKEEGITIEIEKNIKSLLNEYKDLKEKLEVAYDNQNLPLGFPFKELDKRQKEIQQFGFNYENMEKEFNNQINEKYKFKGGITEDYSQKTEFKFMGEDELMTLEKEKLKNQDEKLEGITLDVKTNTTLATNVKYALKDQNKKLEQINEDIERTNEKMSTVTKRFKNYASKISWCKMITILIIEIAVALLIFVLLFN